MQSAVQKREERMTASPAVVFVRGSFCTRLVSVYDVIADASLSASAFLFSILRLSRGIVARIIIRLCHCLQCETKGVVTAAVFTD